MAIVTATAGADSLQDALASWGIAEDARFAPFSAQTVLLASSGSTTGPPAFVVNGRDGMLQAYQRGLERMPREFDVLAYVHDDLILTEPPAPVWERVLAEFDDPHVGLVGFGGALVHGSADLYRTPFAVSQLGRSLYRSNVEDAEIHGERFTEACDVAVLDGFALVVRRAVLERAGGWPVGTPVSYVGYDYWLACETHRMDYRIRLVGVQCMHLGGRTAVALKAVPEDGSGHLEAHRWLWEQYADVLPWDTRKIHNG